MKADQALKVQTAQPEKRRHHSECANHGSERRRQQSRWSGDPDRVSGDIHNIELAGIFVQIGLLPNTNWLEGAVERNRMGEIIIDAKCETNVKGDSQRVTVRRFRTSRSSSPLAKAPKPL